MALRVFAIGAHPDDIEFRMAGTLLLLSQSGCEIHMMTVANGSCGSVEHDTDTITRIRLDEARNAANRIGAIFHPPLVNDIDVFYKKKLLARVSSVMRMVAPDIVLTESPQDYMEDHTNTSRLAVTAAFCRGIPNYPVNPPYPPVTNQVAVYHAQPHGNRDGLNQLVLPDFVIDISSVIEEKAVMLAEHKSQKEWLDHSQGFDAYVETMKVFSREMGALNGYAFGEGWRRHNPIGLGAPECNPLVTILMDYTR